MRRYSGIVVEGRRRGGELGFPTANIPFPADDSDGVYVAEVTVRGKTYQAAVFADPERAILEAYLIDFHGSLYGEELRVELQHKVRDRKRFESDAALRAAIARDVEAVRAHFNKKS